MNTYRLRSVESIMMLCSRTVRDNLLYRPFRKDCIVRLLRSLYVSVLICVSVFFATSSHATVVTYDFSVNLSQAPQEFRIRLGTYYDLFFEMLAYSIPDPEQRAAIVSSMLLQAGIPIEAAIYQPFSTTFGGSFSYDTSVVTPGSVVGGANLLMELPFLLGAATIVQTGMLGWDASGELNQFMFGSNCSAGSCSVDPGNNDWLVSTNDFTYSTDNELDGRIELLESVTYSKRVIPEPVSAALVSTSLLALGLVRRRGNILKR